MIDFYGYRTVSLLTRCGKPILVDFCVAAVRRPILSVGRLASRGYVVAFGPKGGVVRSHARQNQLVLEMRKGTFVLPARPERTGKGRSERHEARPEGYQVFPVSETASSGDDVEMESSHEQ